VLFSADRRTLHAAVREAKRCVANRVTLPSLANVKLVASEGQLTVSSTDLEVHFIQRLSAEVEAPGEVLLDARTLEATLSKLDGERVSCSLPEGERVRLRDDSGADVRLRPGTLEDFPKLTTEVADTHVVDELPARLKTAVVAASTDQGRPVLTGVLLDTDTLVATDSYRMTVVRTPGLDVKALVPATQLKRVLAAKPQKLEVGAHGDEIAFVDPDTRRTWVICTLPGSFPNYATLLPEASATTAQVSVKALTKAIERSVAVSGSNCVTLELDGHLKLTVGEGETSEYEEVIAAETSGPSLTIVFDPTYLKAGAALFSDQLRLELQGALTPAVLTDETGIVRYLLMPRRA
jgi:DNA polymerase III subunit beta